jgi:hypothetical protein
VRSLLECQARKIIPIEEPNLYLHIAGYRFMSPRPRTLKHSSQSLPSHPSRKDLSILHHRPFTRQRHVYCDCGNLAVTVLQLRVGSDPQYIIRMPLCSACLKLEQDMEQD